MTVTKQQQLEWLANKNESWGDDRTIGYMMSLDEVGFVVGLLTRLNGIELLDGHSHLITREEWKQEREKMQKQQDNSWHERGELPPVGCECEVLVNDENKWMHFEVIAIRDGHALGWCRESSCGFQSNEKSEFRPIRTEREKAIDEMMSLVMDGLMSHEMAKELVIKLHDAGYRKVKP